MTNDPDGIEDPPIQQYIDSGIAKAAEHIKVPWSIKQRAYVFLAIGMMGVGCLAWGQHLNDQVKTEQRRFEKASVRNCQDIANAAIHVNSLIDRQVAVLKKAADIPPARRDTLVLNYEQSKITVPDCSVLVPQ